MVQFDQLQLVCIAGYSIKFGFKIGNNTAAIAETSGAKTIKKNTNSNQNTFQTHRAKQYEVTSILSTDCELSTETCSKNVYSLGPRSTQAAISCYVQRYG